MMEKNKPGGLCLNCKSKSTCMFSIKNHEVVFECEEYAATDAIPQESPQRAATIENNMAVISANAKQMGLCSNCVARQDCGNSENEGGVWHCEEYR